MKTLSTGSAHCDFDGQGSRISCFPVYSLEIVLEGDDQKCGQSVYLTLEVNYPCEQETVPHLNEGSSITFISSIAGFSPQKGGLQMYGVTKTALLGLTKVTVLFSFFSYSFNSLFC